MPPWVIVVVVVVLVVGVFLGPFYEALRGWLGLGRAVHVRELSPPVVQPALPPNRSQKTRKRR